MLGSFWMRLPSPLSTINVKEQQDERWSVSLACCCLPFIIEDVSTLVSVVILIWFRFDDGRSRRAQRNSKSVPPAEVVSPLLQNFKNAALIGCLFVVPRVVCSTALSVPCTRSEWFSFDCEQIWPLHFSRWSDYYGSLLKVSTPYNEACALHCIA